MKNYLLLFLLIPVLQSCTRSTEPKHDFDLIKKVEAGLSGPVYFEGDTTWTIEARMAHYGVPGVSIAVIKDNKIEWMKSYGVTNKETKVAVTDKTLFQAGSISKPVAAYGALRTVEEGKINLDENVNTYLKSWKLPDNEFTTNKKVTLKHLLSHTGGLTVHGFLGYSPDLPVPTLVQVLNGEKPANSPPIFVDKLPEESFRYSGGGYCIMQQMVIDIEGKSFPQIMKEKVLQPLDMNNSTYDQPLTGEQLKIAASGYLPDGTMTKGERHTYPEMAAAGLWTTAGDLAKFAINVQQTLQGKSTAVISKAMAEKMITPFVADFEGLGLFLTKKKNDLYFGHGGWDEGFSSEMIAHSKDGYGVVVLTNSNHPEFISEVINSVARNYNWSGFLPTYTALPMDTKTFRSMSGRYHNGSDGSIIVFSKGDRLFMKYLRDDNPFELFRISDSTYLSKDTNHPVNPVQFKLNPADGKLNYAFIEEGKPVQFIHAKESDDIKVPFEYLREGNYKKALEGYQSLLKNNPKDNAISEGNLNGQGYDQLSRGKTQLAKDIFKINMGLYPTSSNVYDSYAEACMKNGDKQEAIDNYEKSLKMNPANKNAEKHLKELGK